MMPATFLISHAADDDSGLGGGAGRAADGGAAVAALGLPGDRAQAPHRHRLQLQTGTMLGRLGEGIC